MQRQHSPVHYIEVRGIFRHLALGSVVSSTEMCLPGRGARNGDWMHVNADEVQHFAGRVLESRAKPLASGGAGQERKEGREPLEGEYLNITSSNLNWYTESSLINFHI